MSQPSSPNTFSRTHSDSLSEDGDNNGQEEITSLARKIIQYINGEFDSDMDRHAADGMAVGSGQGRVVGSGRGGRGTPRHQESAASSVNRRIASQLPGEGEAELRRSVRDALGSSDDDA